MNCKTCAPEQHDIVRHLRLCRWALEERIFSDETPREWDIPDPVTRAIVKSLIGAVIDAEHQILLLRGQH